jgi:hypothetical protein
MGTGFVLRIVARLVPGEGVRVMAPEKRKKMLGITWRDRCSPFGPSLHQWAMKPPGKSTLGGSWRPVVVKSGELVVANAPRESWL